MRFICEENWGDDWITDTSFFGGVSDLPSARPSGRFDLDASSNARNELTASGANAETGLVWRRPPSGRGSVGTITLVRSETFAARVDCLDEEDCELKSDLKTGVEGDFCFVTEFWKPSGAVGNEFRRCRLLDRD
jgi:hypothetical protein